MKIAIFTGNAIRHKFVANVLAKSATDALVVSECDANDAAAFDGETGELSLTQQHFYERNLAEKKFFEGNDVFTSPTLPILEKELNLPYVYEVIRNFKPDAAFVFGSSIIKEPLLSLIPTGRFINLHLGLSPYYRGSGTNFWPFVNDEPEFVGSTLLHIDAGVDTGDIIRHVRPQFEADDTVHSAGCKVIKSSAEALSEILAALEAGRELPRAKQWQTDGAKYYKKKDFDGAAVLKYRENIKNGLVKNYLSQGPKSRPVLIEKI